MRSSMMRLMVVLVSRSKSRQKVKESSKSPKNLKGLKSCKGYWFGGTFTEAPILRRRTRASVIALTVFQAPQELPQYHFYFNYRQSKANRAADALFAPSSYLRSAHVPSATSALGCTLLRHQDDSRTCYARSSSTQILQMHSGRRRPSPESA